jgi:DNA invertase Pin-like site-specific DNA recombinase
MSQVPNPLPPAFETKIGGRHHERLAVVYVRQSSPHQVQRHQESTQLQYGLVSHAERLGWPRERIAVIDDDLGVSGASSEGRPGFQRLLSEVALDHVGVILGVEMSRLARSCKDWYQLLELCALFGTLICDLDGLYDPASYNDRLLLGLKGTMSEAELHILQQRMWQGALQKARRGELPSKEPVGYVRAAGGLVMDPDEQARSVVRLVFDQFERLGSMHAVLRHLVAEGVRLPVRPASGPNKGQLEWRRPNQTALQNMLPTPSTRGPTSTGGVPRARRPGGRSAPAGCRGASGSSCCGTGTRPTSPGSSSRRTNSAWSRTARAAARAAALPHLEQDAAVRQRLLGDAVAPEPRLDLGLLDGVHLNQPVEVPLVAPLAAEVVVADDPGGGVDDDRVLPVGEPDEQARGLAAVKPRGAVGGLGEAQPAAGRGDGGRVAELGLDLDEVRHGFVSLSLRVGGMERAPRARRSASKWPR